MVTCVGLAFCLLPASALASDLIGLTVPPYPHALRDIGGSCVSDRSGYEHICDYSMGVLADGPEEAPVSRYVIAARMAGREGQQARWLITDAVPYPRSEPGYHLQTGTCRLDGREDDRVIAVVRDSLEGELLKDVLWAQRLELPDGKFTPLDSTKVDCLNEAYLGL